MCGTYVCVCVCMYNISCVCPQDRKLLVKTLKGVVCKVCGEENGHVVMMGLFDSVDDTVLLKKVILNVRM